MKLSLTGTFILYNCIIAQTCLWSWSREPEVKSREILFWGEMIEPGKFFFSSLESEIEGTNLGSGETFFWGVGDSSKHFQAGVENRESVIY